MRRRDVNKYIYKDGRTCSTPNTTVYCTKCKKMSTQTNLQMTCCGTPVNMAGIFSAFEPEKIMPTYGVWPKPAEVAIMIKEQDNKCFYCEVPFNSEYRIWPSRKVLTTKPKLNHLIPICKGGTAINNTVVACDLCCRWKSIRGFYTAEAAKKYMKKITLSKAQFINIT